MNWWKQLIGVMETTEAPTPYKEYEARLPEQPFVAGGSLEEGSQTWIYIRSWAGEELVRAREKNDSVNADPTQTAVLRGEIRILKRLISLPKPKYTKGLLEKASEYRTAGESESWY